MERNTKTFRVTAVIIACLLVLPLFLFNNSSADENEYYYYGAYNTGKDNGYSGHKEIDDDDPHYGWDIGKFRLSGFTSTFIDPVNNSGNQVYLKNVGTTIRLSFILEQDIDCLNDDEDLSIYDDQDGTDQQFCVEKGDIGRGCLIIQKTDYKNLLSEPIVYTDYLTGLTVGADTEIDVYEEGDYEVVLDYEIRKDNLHIFGWNTAPTYYNYRIHFSFSVRNGNCMVYIRDAQTTSELADGTFTANGFYLDLANSHYLRTTVTRSTLSSNGYTLVEDTRFNKEVDEGEVYTAEGIYVINVTNQYTGVSTEKTIYVGDDEVLRAYVTNDYSLQEIQDMISQGATITSDGTILTPTPTPTPSPTPTPEPTTTPTDTTVESESPTPEPTATPTPEIVETTTVETTVATEPVSESMDLSTQYQNEETEKSSKLSTVGKVLLIIAIVFVSVAAITAITIVTIVRSVKRRNRNRLINANEDIETIEEVGEENSNIVEESIETSSDISDESPDAFGEEASEIVKDIEDTTGDDD